jgi:5-methylcytosine-specific restriction endonuclease McrA
MSTSYYERNRAKVLEAKRIHRIENHEAYVQRDRERYLSTLEYQKQRNANYRANNPEKRRVAMKSWRDRNPDKIKAYSKRYYKDHEHAMRVKALKYYREHLEECLLRSRKYNATRRLMEKNQGDGYSAAEVRLQYSSQHGKCWHCGKHVGKKFHVDHLIPLKKGGRHDASNIVIACAFCNLSKKDKLCYLWNGRLF